MIEDDKVMKSATVMIAAAILAACSSQDTSKEHGPGAAEAVRDFVKVRGLEEVDRMPTTTQDGWTSIDNEFLIYRGRRDTYLVEFNRRCNDLDDSTRIIADERWDSNNIRARFDTIRGCRIDKIYGLTEAEVAELENIGDAPGSRN